MVKDLVIKTISSEDAKRVIIENHYSKKTTQNSQINLGVFYKNILYGAMQFGPSIDKNRMAKNLNVGFNEFLELNRMAFHDRLPKNSESRALSVAIRIIKKNYPFIRLIVSFADACQCGDGTIYRASGFKLHSYKKNTSLLVSPTGEVVAKKSLDNSISGDGKYLSSVYINEKGYRPLNGFQMKYVYFFDKNIEKNYSFIDFDSIRDIVSMYKGKRAPSVESSTSDFQSEGGGESPTDALQSKALNG